VSRYAADADVAVLRAIFQRDHGQWDYGQNGLVMDDIASPEALITASAGCRAIVTGSYHAGVFGLAQGVPAVCLSRSSYYQAKFGGLQSLFPGACFVVQLDAPDWNTRLSAAIRQAWHLPAPARASARDKAVRLRDAGRGAYAQFRTKVEAPAMITADR
jgi:colanic acid/amylovoran biosynthesis protein